MDSSVGLWLGGLLLAIPVGVAANLLTPIARRGVATVSTRSRRSLEIRRQAYSDAVMRLVSNPAALQVYMAAEVVRVSVRTFFVVGVLGIAVLLRVTNTDGGWLTVVIELVVMAYFALAVWTTTSTARRLHDLRRSVLASAGMSDLDHRW